MVIKNVAFERLDSAASVATLIKILKQHQLYVESNGQEGALICLDVIGICYRLRYPGSLMASIVKKEPVMEDKLKEELGEELNTMLKNLLKHDNGDGSLIPISIK